MEGEFLALLNNHRGVLRSVSRAYTSRPEDREDLVQEIICQLWRAFASYRRESAPLTWVYRIALNTAITGLRRRTRRPAHLPIEVGLHLTSCAPAGTDERIELLERAIRRLSDLERAIVTCYLDDLTYRQMADVLGISETNVGARLSRTKAKLQRIVKEME